MTLVVHAWGAYASYVDRPWRQEDYSVNKVVKVLKGKPINGHANVRDADGQWRLIQNGSRPNALAIFTAWARSKVPNPIALPFVLVPVPCSECVTFDAPSTPVAMADVLAARIGAGSSVGRWLRFEHPMPKSHEGGSRRQSVLEAALVFDGRSVTAGTTVVLVDDVKTTGSHLRACARVLRGAGCNVHTVLTAAATVWEPVANPFDVPPVDLEANALQATLDDFV
jgi:hypothetical protein